MKIDINKSFLFFGLLLVVLLQYCCKKFLDEKPDQQLVIPETLQDAQALLDYYAILNSAYPSIGDQSDDNFYTTDTRYNAMNEYQRLLYSWGANPVTDLEYRNLYRIILNANVSMETLAKVQRSGHNSALWDQVKGTALFYRSYALYHALQYFSMPYDASVAIQLPGVALRPSSNINIASTRASMQESWDHIVQQTEEAIALLPLADIVPSRPTKAAGWAILARIKMAMHNYDDCKAAAQQSLAIYRELINFNTLNANATAPFTRFNKEVVFPAVSTSGTQLTPANYSLDTLLYNSYHNNDLRRTIYFRNNSFGGKGFKGSLNGTANGVPFTGIATDEVYLMFAESAARTGAWQEGLDSLNSLLRTRWRTATFVPFTAANQADAVSLILKERRKELILRGARWFDLRRFSKETAYAITPKRILAGTEYLLPPDSKRYVFLFPQEVISISGMQQNER